MQTAFAVAPTPTPPPFSVGSVIGRTFSTWSRNLVPFTLLAAIVNGPLFVIGVWHNFAEYGGYPSFQEIMARAQAQQQVGGPFAAWSVLSFSIWLATMVLIFVQMGAFTYGAVQHLAGRKVSVSTLLSVGFRRAWPVFLAGLVSGILTGLATILLIVPGIIVACGLIAAIPAVVAEAKGPMDAVRRSFALTKGRRFGIFVAWLVMGLVAWTLNAIAGILPLALGGGIASLLGAIVAFGVGAVSAPLWTLLPAVAYHDLRVEKEGVDTAELAKVFE